jgi:hypothetical protein
VFEELLYPEPGLLVLFQVWYKVIQNPEKILDKNLLKAR